MRILVVEDEHRIAASIKKGLELENYAVDLAFDGKSGFDMATGEEYDLIILDLMLPVIDGLTVCKKLRSEKIHTPVLMLTAKSLTSNKVQGLDSGADDYLTKPFAFEELVARVRALYRRPKSSLGNILTVETLKLDTNNKNVERKGKEIPLSRREFSLLEYLMRNQGKILTKNQIIDHVWSYDDDVLPNTVEVNIKNLRSKIDTPLLGKSLIKTVRGFGYKIEK